EPDLGRRKQHRNARTSQAALQRTVAIAARPPRASCDQGLSLRSWPVLRLPAVFRKGIGTGLGYQAFCSCFTSWNAASFFGNWICSHSLLDRDERLPYIFSTIARTR